VKGEKCHHQRKRHCGDRITTRPHLRLEAINRSTRSSKPGIKILSDNLNLSWPTILLLPVLALLTGCASPIPQVPVAIHRNTPPSNTPLMVTPNPDGTVTVKKEAANGNPQNGGGSNGLVIPAQVILPTVRTAEKQQDGTSPF
jgi:hypothetical protein